MKPISSILILSLACSTLCFHGCRLNEPSENNNPIATKPDTSQTPVTNHLSLTGFISLDATSENIPAKIYSDVLVVTTFPDSSKQYGLANVFYRETWNFQQGRLEINISSDSYRERGKAQAKYECLKGNMLKLTIDSSTTSKYVTLEERLYAYKVLDSTFIIHYTIDNTKMLFTGPGIIRRYLYVGLDHKGKEIRYLQDSYMK